MSEDELSRLERLRALLQAGAIEQEEYDLLKGRILAGSRAGSHLSAPLDGGGYSPLQGGTSLTLTEGDEIGPPGERYRLEARIGGGGMGEVWRALDLGRSGRQGTECRKAVKLLPEELSRSPRHLALLGREADLASDLSHPNIVNVYGLHRGERGPAFIVMEYLEGADLEQRLLAAGEARIPWHQTLVWLDQAAQVLDYAWEEHRLVHRDLKPANLFITGRGQLKVLDFGIARQIRHTMSRLTHRIDGSGTAAYMPPEAFVAGPVDRRQDVYALGCISYEILVGEAPFDPVAARVRPRELYPPRPEGVGEGVWQAIRAALAYERDQRPGSAGELVRGLRRVDPVPQAATLKDAGRSRHYTKLDARGQELPDDAGTWCAVRDNKTGLVWELKTDSGPRGKDRRFNWAQAFDYAKEVNVLKACGFGDWRVPTIDELMTLVDQDKVHREVYGWTIDGDYFPDKPSSYPWFWSASPRASDSEIAWAVNFYGGNDGWGNRSDARRVRLVCAGQ